MHLEGQQNILGYSGTLEPMQPRLRLAIAQANYCSSFQLTHMPHGNHAQSIASNGGQREDKTLLQCSQLSQHGEFWHVSVSERQR